MKKKQNLRAIQAQRFLRYSIRKFTVGVASVAIASGLAVLGGTNVQAAAEEVVNTHATETKAPETGKNIKTEVAEKVNTSKLSEAIERLSQLLGKVTETEKTTTTITAAKELLSKAQQAVSRSDIQQSEVDKFTSELTSKAFVLESMPKEKDKKTEKEADKSTEEKVNKNQDPRNGKAIPGKGESGFRTDTSSNNGTTTVTNDVLTPTTPAKPTAKNIIGSTSTVSRENFTGWDTYKMPFGVQSGSGTLGVDSAEQKANAEGLQFRVFSDQREGTRVTPGPSNFTFQLKASDVKARVDYGLKLPAEEVQKIIEEAPLWSGKLRYDNTRLQRAAASTYFGGGPYEYLMSSIYKLGYEQGIDKVYVKDASKRIEVTEEAKAAGWTVSDFTVSNMPGGLVYDKQSDSIQGVVTHGSPFNYQKLVATVTFTNTKTGKNVRIPLDLHRYGGTAWKDGTPPTLEINDAVKEGKVGEELVVPVEYRDAGASHAGAPNGRNIPYNLTDENGNPLNRTATIRETVGRAILGVSGVKITGTTGAGASTVTDLTGDDTKIPGVGFTIASNDMTERNKNGFKGTPTEAGIYRVSIYARDYKETNANEAYAHATFKISPAVSVKNVHAYDKEVPITISRGASEATITLPDGTNTKIVAKDGKWVVSETTNTAVNVNDEIGTVGETFNLKVLPTATAKAATDNINVTASSENVTATFTRAEVALKTRLGENVTATFNKVTGRWDLPAEIAEKKTVNSDGTTTWLKRDLYVDVDKNGETIFNVYEYIRTLNAEGKVTAVSDPTRTLTTYNKENAANSAAESANDTNKGMIVTVKYDKGLNKWTADDNSTVTATKTGDKWTISTSSGFNGTVDAVHAESTDKASVLNDVPTVHSTSYTTVKGAIVDLVKQKSATVTITDREDDATTAPNKKETTVTKVTLTAPSEKVTEYTSLAAAAAVKLTETGEYTVKVDVKDSNGNKVTADSDTATGTNENDNSAVASTTYVITVKDQETNKLYKVEDDTVTNDELKAKVNPTTVDGFTPSKNDITDIPTTTGKAGQTLPTPATVTYTKDTETIQVETKVDVVVLPKVTPTGVTVLKDSTNLENLVKEKATEAAAATTKLPDGVTVRVKEVKAGTVPTTTATGPQTPATAVVEYVKDGKVVETKEVEVPVTVVGSTPKPLVVFEGDTVEAKTVQDAVTTGTDGTKGNPAIPEDLTKTPGKKEVTVPVTYEGIKDPEQVKVPVTVLPKPEADEILVAKNSDKEKAKEKVLAKAKKAIEDSTFKGKLPQDATVTVDETATITVPDLAEDTEVEVTVNYTVPGQDKPLTTTVKVPVTIVDGVPQIVPVKETNDVLPDPEKSIDKEDYPEGSTFRYKTPEGQTTPIDVTTTGDKNVVVEVLDPQGNPIVEVPATVRVVGSTPQFVVADPTKKQPEVKDSITPGDYPEGTTFEYKTPVDTTTAGEKDVTVVAKLNGQPIVEVPAKVVVVDPKTQYVVADPSKPQPDASKSIDPEQYPEGTTFEYKTPVDTTTPGEKDVVVIAKDGEDKLVEVPTKVKVVQGNPQIVPVDEGKKQPSPEDSIDSNDYPDDATFEYKEEVDTSTPGDKKVTVVVKQGDKVLVEVPSTVRVVESYPKYVPVDPAKKQPDPKENINPNDFPTGTTFEYKDNTPVDTTTPGEKPVTVVAKLNGQPITEIPATIVVVEPKTQYVPVNAENDKKPKPQNSITPDDYPEGSTFEYKTPEGQTTPYDGTTPGEKDVTVVVKDSDGDTIVEVPAKIKVVQGKEQLTPVNAEDKDKPKAEDSITPSDYPEGSTFEYKVPEGQTTPYDGTTPGDKSVTVVVKDKDGKVLVEVPATIKVVESKPTPIETPVTTTPLTQDDYTKGIKIPDGGKITKVENIPDLTTPGKKDPVKVMITLPNGKVVTVEVPVNVTPIEEIVKKQGDPITEEDVEKHIPKGAKVISIGDKPTTDVPGEKPSIPVVIELPNGIRVTMDIPVIVTPKVTPVVVSVGTPVTPEDVEKHIELPKGWKVTKVGEIPTTETPGAKPVVKVEIELPDGRKITVDVPVIVTPTVRQIVVPQGTPITPDDVKGHIDLPKEPGWEIVEVGEIPTTIPAGVKPSVKVKIKVPTGEIIEVDVPVIVTPKVTPIVVEVGTPITEEDVKKKVDLPEGWEIVEVGEIPTTETPGAKPVVKVKVKLPDGRIITVDVPVTVTPKSQNGGGAIAQNGDSTVQIVTEYLDENGNRITSDKEGKHNPIELEGYEFSHSTTDAKGNTLHHYKKVTPKAPQAVEEVPTTKQEQPSTPEVKSTPVAKQELPNTGTTELEVFTPAVLAILAGLGLATPTVAKKKDEE